VDPYSHKESNLSFSITIFLYGVAPHRYQAKKDGLPQNNKNEHNTQNFRFGVFQNFKLMGMCRTPIKVEISQTKL